MHPDTRLADKPRMPCCNFALPYSIVQANTMIVHHCCQISKIASGIEWQVFDYRMTYFADDKAIQAVAAPWHDLDSQPALVHMLPWQAHTKLDMSKAYVVVYIMIPTSFCCS